MEAVGSLCEVSTPESTLTGFGTRPGPGWGPYGPIRALMLVFKSEAFRVQTAPFDKIRIDLWRSPEASTHLRPSGSQKTKA